MKRMIGLLVACSLGVFALAVHADERIGTEIPLPSDVNGIASAPRAVSDGLGTLVVWATYSAVYSARIDGDGNLSSPFLLASGFGYRRDVDIATDGRTALVVWSEEGIDVEGVKAVRLGPTGAPLDAAPFAIDSHKRGTISLFNSTVAFDGAFFRVLWLSTRSGANSGQLHTQRIGTDGSLFSRQRRVLVRGMARFPFEPRVGCLRNGQCLVTWFETGGQDRVAGVRLMGDEVIDTGPVLLVRNLEADGVAISSDGSGYLLLGMRRNFACGQSFCGIDAIVGRVTSDGVPLDVPGIRVNNPPALGVGYVAGVGLTFDGANYLAAFLDQSTSCGFKLFGARITPDGTVLNPDTPGLLLSDAGTALSAAIAATHTHAVATWQDTRANQTCAAYPPKSVYAQRVLAHAEVPASETVEIGAIGPRGVAEQDLLRFTVLASALNPATATLAVTNLPVGAVFDAATQTFQWKPAPNEAGLYPGVHFEATDGVQTVSEDVTITVLEGSLSLCGTVEHLNVAVPNVAVRIKGGLAKPRAVFSDAAGQFCFYYLIPSTYTLSLAPPSKKQYKAVPLVVTVPGTDVKNVQFAVN